jgi:hypothetical protein
VYPIAKRVSSRVLSLAELVVLSPTHPDHRPAGQAGLARSSSMPPASGDEVVRNPEDAGVAMCRTRRRGSL